MVTKSLRKNFWRDIRQSISRFLAIFMITALGAGFFSGLRATGPDMKRTADEYYSEYNLMDYRIQSAMGFTQEDVEALRAQPGVESVMPAQRLDVLAQTQAGEASIRLHTLPGDRADDNPDYHNRLMLLRGRLPEAPNECVVGGSSFVGDNSFRLGERLTISTDNTASALEMLAVREFTVVGVALSPLYVSKFLGGTTVGGGSLTNYVYVPLEAFDLDIYTEIYLRAADVQVSSAFAPQYTERIDAGTDALEALGTARAPVRHDAVYGEAERKLADAEAELDEARATADSALGRAAREIADGAAVLTDKQAELDEARAAIDTGYAELAQAKAKLDAALPLLESGKALLDANQNDYDINLSDYNRQKATFDAKKSAWETADAQVSALAAATSGAVMAGAFSAMSGALAGLAPNPEQPGAATQFSAAATGVIIALRGVSALAATSSDPAAQAVGTYLAGVADAAQSPLSAGNYAAAYAVLDSGLNTTAQPAPGGGTGLAAAQNVVTGARQELNTQKTALDSAAGQLAAAKSLLDTAAAQLADGWAQYNSEKAAYDAGLAAYNAGAAILAEGSAGIAEGEKQLADARRELADARRLYREEKANVDQKLADAEREIADRRAKLRDLAEPKWYVFTRDGNPGYTGFASDSDRIGAIASIIPIFFFLVAALVCLTTMTRMVEDQRVQIGMLKAQGFSKFSIAFKYIAYAATASTAGAVTGILVGLRVFPTTIWNAYSILYSMPAIRLDGNAGVIAVSLGISILTTTIAALFACYGALSSVPAELMRPKAPKAGKRVLLEHVGFVWKRMKFSNKVMARNLFLSKKRFFMTILGVLGCTSLLLAGFGLLDAITGIGDYQFGTIGKYDLAVAVYDDSGSQADTPLNRLFSENADFIYKQEVPVEVSSARVEHSSLDVNLYVSEDAERLNRFVRFAERESGQPIAFPQGDGVILTEKLATTLQVGVGDTITVRTTETDGTDVTATLRVAGVTENYVYHMIFLSPQTYVRGFGRTPAYDTALVRFHDDMPLSRGAMLEKIMADENVVGLLDVDVLRGSVNDMLTSLNAVVLLIIISAAALAFVVLYNLTNINITERAREIATLKVLGFYEKEVNRYIFRENRALTVIGTLLGLVGGIFLSRYITTAAEVDDVMFRRVIQPQSYLYAVAFTLLSAELVNLIMRRRLRKIDMVDSLKSTE